MAKTRLEFVKEQLETVLDGISGLTVISWFEPDKEDSYAKPFVAVAVPTLAQSKTLFENRKTVQKVITLTAYVYAGVNFPNDRPDSAFHAVSALVDTIDDELSLADFSDTLTTTSSTTQVYAITVSKINGWVKDTVSSTANVEFEVEVTLHQHYS